MATKGLSDVDRELLIASQTDELVRVTKQLASAFCKTVLQQILAANDSGVDGDFTALLNRCADFLTFGAIGKCNKCGDGDMMFTKNGYTCNGTREWIPCANFKRNPKRFLCVIPENLGCENFLSTCNLFVTNRAVRKKGKIAIDYKSIYGEGRFKLKDYEKEFISKNESAVDPEFEEQEEMHVYRYQGEIFSCVLALVDVNGDKNSFYTLQVLQSDRVVTDFWLFTKGGRIGTTIRNPQSTAFKSAKAACAKFKEIFKFKTDNDWDPCKAFEKKPGKFHVVKVECENDIVNISKSLLPKVVD